MTSSTLTADLTHSARCLGIHAHRSVQSTASTNACRQITQHQPGPAQLGKQVHVKKGRGRVQMRHPQVSLRAPPANAGARPPGHVRSAQGVSSGGQPKRPGPGPGRQVTTRQCARRALALAATRHVRSKVMSGGSRQARQAAALVGRAAPQLQITPPLPPVSRPHKHA